jgi:hypothetical protein
LPRCVQFRGRIELRRQPPQQNSFLQFWVDKNTDQIPPIQANFVEKLVAPGLQKLTDRIKILDSTAQRIQLQDGRIQALLPRRSGEGRGLPEVDNQVPLLAGPGP